MGESKIINVVCYQPYFLFGSEFIPGKRYNVVLYKHTTTPSLFYGIESNDGKIYGIYETHLKEHFLSIEEYRNVRIKQLIT